MGNTGDVGAQDTPSSPPPLVQAAPTADSKPPAAPPSSTTEVSRPASAPEGKDAPKVRLNRLTCDPLLIGFGVLPIEYERAVSQDLSVAVGLQLDYPALGALFGVASLGAGLTGEVRYFPLADPAPSGLWVGPQFRGGLVSSAIGSVGVASLSFGGLAMVGYTYISPGGLTLSAGGGLGLGWAAAVASSSSGSSSAAGFSPALALHANVGYAF